MLVGTYSDNQAYFHSTELILSLFFIQNTCFVIALITSFLNTAISNDKHLYCFICGGFPVLKLNSVSYGESPRLVGFFFQNSAINIT